MKLTKELRAYIEHEKMSRGWNNADLSQASNLSEATWSRILNQTRPQKTISDKVLEKIGKIFGDSPIEILSIAEGLSLKKKASHLAEESPPYHLRIARLEEENAKLQATQAANVEVPLYNVSFATGAGTLPEGEEVIGGKSFDAVWIKRKGLDPDRLAIAHVQGDSMEPLLKNKDLVLLNLDQTEPLSHLPVAFRLENELYIKMCRKTGDGRIEMVSENPKYPPIIIDPKKPPSDFEIEGAVIWHAHGWM